MAYAIFGLLAVLFACWIWSEYRVVNPPTRIALGSSVILMLTGFLFALAQSSFIRDSHNAAAIRLLGEALDDGDFQSAQNAIQQYNSISPRPTGYAIVEILSDRKRLNEQ